jgi:hypothetical protein
MLIRFVLKVPQKRLILDAQNSRMEFVQNVLLDFISVRMENVKQFQQLAVITIQKPRNA